MEHFFEVNVSGRLELSNRCPQLANNQLVSKRISQQKQMPHREMWLAATTVYIIEQRSSEDRCTNYKRAQVYLPAVQLVKGTGRGRDITAAPLSHKANVIGKSETILPVSYCHSTIHFLD